MTNYMHSIFFSVTYINYKQIKKIFTEKALFSLLTHVADTWIGIFHQENVWGVYTELILLQTFQIVVMNNNISCVLLIIYIC